MIKKQKNRKIGETIFFWSILILPLIQFCIFYIGVNFNSILLSLKTYDYKTGEFYYSGFNNFILFFDQFGKSGNLMWTYLENSLIFFLAGLGITTPLSILFSYYIYKNGHRKFQKYTASNAFAAVSKILLFLPTVMPSIAIVLMYKYFGENSLPKMLNEIFGSNFTGLLSSSETNMIYMLCFCTLIGFGTDMILYTGAMSSIDDSLLESAQIDGASPIRELTKIVLPAIYPTLSMKIVLSVAGIFTNQAFLFSFYGADSPYSLRTFGYYLFITVNNSPTMADYPYAAAMGIVFTLIATPITLITKYLLEKYGPSQTKDGKIKVVK